MMHDGDLFLVVYQLATTIAGIPLVPKNIVHTTSPKMIRVTFPDNAFFWLTTTSFRRSSNLRL